jgi:hypothetical protein
MSGGFKLLTRVVHSGSKTCLSNGIAVARTAPRFACGPHSIVTTCKREREHVSTIPMQVDEYDTRSSSIIWNEHSLEHYIHTTGDW